mmetsp:Transcript_15465/g.20550  ORF Transcript_15465/g.20550 Transcript_15465/m.20550 type:complete len:403 (-) Transcript_15465:1170-2378(-)
MLKKLLSSSFPILPVSGVLLLMECIQGCRVGGCQNVTDEAKTVLDGNKENARMKKPVWFDSDIMSGHGFGSGRAADQDDGFALAALMHSSRIELVGMSAVWGNGPVEETYRKLVELADFYDLGSTMTPKIHRGCSRPIAINTGEKVPTSRIRPVVEESDAVIALTDYLQHLPDGEMLTILAVGPLTNIGTVLLRNPDLASKIEEVVVCAGRSRPEEHFIVGTEQKAPFGDMNFDFDITAFEIMLQLEIPLVLAGWQISTAFWMEIEDLVYLQNNTRHNLVRYLVHPENYSKWLETWQSMGNRIDQPTQPIKGFHPFDLLTASYLYYREGVKVEQRRAKILLHSDDTLPDKDNFFKYYLSAPENSANGSGTLVKFVTDAVDREEYKRYIMNLLLAESDQYSLT